MKLKKVLACILASGIAFSAWHAVSADVVIDESDIQYIENGDGTLSITGYTGNEAEFVIPEEINGKKVTGLRRDSFYNCTSITIPASITDISGQYYWQVSMQKLETIIVDENNQNFSSADGIIFNKDKTELMAYPRQKRDKEYMVPDSVKKIDRGALYRIDFLEKITISANVENIELADVDGALLPFALCMELAVIDVNVNNENYCSVDGVLFDKNMTKLIQYPQGKSDDSYSIPDGLETIPMGTFSGAKFSSLFIPKSVTEISPLALSSVGTLKEITVDDGNTVYSSADGVLYNKDKSTLIAYPCAKEDKVVTIPETVKRIEAFAFDKNANITSINISKNVSEIGERAFSYCYALAEIMVDESNTDLSSVENVLYNADQTRLIYYPLGKSGESFDIPETVNEIDNGAFESNDKLTSITIPEGVTKINETSFSWCRNLKSLYIPESVTEIHEYFWIGLSQDVVIYGIEGSYAEKCCIEKGFNFNGKAPSLLPADENDTSGVEIMVNEKSFDEGTILEVIKSETVEEDGKKTVSFDITPKNEATGEKVQPNGYVTVKIPVPDGWNAQNCRIYHEDENGVRTLINTWLVDGYIVFKTNHFSTYVLEEYENAEEPDPDDTTAPDDTPDITTDDYEEIEPAAPETSAPAETTVSVSEEETGSTSVNETTAPESYVTVSEEETGPAAPAETVSVNTSVPANATGSEAADKTDTNVNTGVIIAFVPAAMAAFGVIASKKRK